jgi:hypothetical protein
MQRGIEISPQERYIAAEIDYELNEKGEVVERAVHIKLPSNVRFAFMLLEKAHELPPQFDASAEWWFCLRESIKVRDRLVHPRMPGDLDVSSEERIKARKAKNGFDGVLHYYIDFNTA